MRTGTNRAQLQGAHRILSTILSCRMGVLAACLALAPPAYADTPQTGGTLVTGFEWSPRGFDPLAAQFLTHGSSMVLDLVQERLFELDDAGRLAPALALSAEASEDGTEWTIRLRDGIRFHDGTPFDASAVAHHWRRLLDRNNPYAGQTADLPIQSVEAIDASTVRFTLRQRWAAFPRMLAETNSLASYVPAPSAVDAETQNRHPVGTGPFRFVEWRSGDRIIVERNPDYWRPGLPHLDRVEARFLPDAQSRFASLRAGDVDLIWTDRGIDIEAAQADPGLVPYEVQGNGAEIIVINTRRPPFDDVRVRRAVAHAWNQEASLRGVYRGTLPRVEHPLGAEAGCGDVGYPAHDPDAARRLLAEYGAPVQVDYLHTATARGRETGAILRTLLADVGIEVTLVPLQPSEMVRAVISGRYAMSGWRLPHRTDMGAVLFAFFHSESRRNRTLYTTPEMDALLEAQRLETDREIRRSLLCEIARRINADLPILYRGGQAYYFFADPAVRGIPPVTSQTIRLGEAWLDR